MLKETEKEIQVMKALRGNDRIVEYLDSEMKRLEGRREGGPGWEVFILMEFCGGKSAGHGFTNVRVRSILNAFFSA